MFNPYDNLAASGEQKLIVTSGLNFSIISFCSFCDRPEEFPEEDFLGDFVIPKYGTYARNIHGMIEHAHYHLGQIALIKKMIQSNNEL